jgi:hypothetical protein
VSAGGRPRAVTAEQRLVTFVQYDRPALPGGEYTITTAQETNQPAPYDRFTASRRFAVAAERFTLDPAELAAVFPPDLAVGDLAGALPHVLITRRTLPWQRRSVPGDDTAPWLAILVFDEADAPVPVRRTAKELIPYRQRITVAGSDVTGEGTMPEGCVSYPSINPLDYGQGPDDQCMTIDVDRALFSAVAPSAADLPFLAHIRVTDTADGRDTDKESASFAVVLGNRIPAPGTAAHAYLVSLEGMGPLLPDADGRPAAGFAGATAVRLLTYRWWSFTATTADDATFESLLRGVNAGAGSLTTLQLPYPSPRPDAGRVELAMSHQAAGALTGDDAAVLSHNAFGLGYVPVVHRLRHGGQTLSWYRGPLAPLPVTVDLPTPVPAPDAATRYNPQTGMFDISYSAAWQLGRLLALGSTTFAVALCDWRSRLRAGAVTRARHAQYASVLGDAFESVVGRRAARLAADPPPPEDVTRWLSRLALLHGVPFSYLVPDERMLPPESLRMFHLDHAWVEALTDGAFSLGRGVAGDLALDAAHAPAVRALGYAGRRDVRRNPLPPGRRPSGSAPAITGTGEITGFLLRSAVVAGWPDAAVIGYADAGRTTVLELLRSALLGTDVLLCLFDGVVRVVAVREPPGQLHCGVLGAPGRLTTTLRQVTGATPGRPYSPPREAAIPARADGRTVVAAAAAASIGGSVGLPVMTSAEFALETVKGVVEVEFRSAG